MTKTKPVTKLTLVSAVVALMLCFAMLLGTTYAWFTDSVTSSGNIIKTGKLDVKMYWSTSLTNSTWNDVEAAATNKIFNYELWEPGYTEIRYVKIVNDGNLALKYHLNIVPNDAAAMELADVLDVYYDENAQTEYTREAIAAATPTGTLAQVIAADSINGVLLPEGQTQAGFYTKEIVVALAVRMQETAGNDYMDMTLGEGFSLNLVATQYTYEGDSFDNQYDNAAQYPAVATATVTANQETVVTAGGMTVTVPAGSANADANDTLTLNVENFNSVTEGENVVVTVDAELVDQDGHAVSNSNTPLTVKFNVGAQNAGKQAVIKHDNEVVATVVVDAQGYVTYTAQHFCVVTVTMNAVEAADGEQGTDFEAYLNGKGYASFRNAINLAAAGDTVYLLKDITLGRVSAEDNVAVSVVKNLIIDGGGHTLNVTAGRGIWVDNGNVSLTVRNLKVIGNNKCERGVQVNGGKTGITLVIENCEVLSTMYAVNICNDASVDLVIRGSKITGWSAINAWAADYIIKINDSELYGVNDKTYNAEGWNDFGTVVLEGDTTNQTNDHSESVTVEIYNTKITAQTTGQGNKQWCILFNKQSVKNTVRLEGCSFVYDENANTFFALDNGTENALYVNGTLYVFPSND